jgi:hypothetical protein
MSPGIIEIIVSKAFLSEIHKLLWIAPLVNKGVPDGGWSCREHALLVSILLRLHALPSAIVFGKAMFVQGPKDNQVPLLRGIDTRQQGMHAWLHIEGLGLLDISPNLERFDAWAGIPFDCIVCDRWMPPDSGRIFQCASLSDYDRQIAEATHANGENRAIYWEAERKHLGASIIRDAARFADSPLSNRLKQEHGGDILVKAALHIIDRSSGRGRSLAGVSQSKAWRIIAERPGKEPVGELLGLLEMQ